MVSHQSVILVACACLFLSGCIGPGASGGPGSGGGAASAQPSTSSVNSDRLVIEPASLALALAPPRGVPPLYPRSAQLTVYKVTGDGREKLLDGLVWTSDDSDRAGVDPQGLVVSGLEAGTVPIRVKHAPSGLEARIDVKVEDLSGAQISVE